MGEGGGHDPGCGRLCPFVEGRGPRRKKWWPVRCRRVRRGLECGLGVWVCWRADRDIVLRGCDSEEVGTCAEHMRWGYNRNVVLLHSRGGCDKGLQGCCQVKGLGVALGPEVEHIPVRVVRFGQGDPGEALVRQVVVAEERLRVGVLHNNGGFMRVLGRFWRELAWSVVGHRGPGAVDDMGGAVELPLMDRHRCGQGGCVAQLHGEGQQHYMTVVSALSLGRKQGGGRWRSVGAGLEF